jgi:hypothetical protein
MVYTPFIDTIPGVCGDLLVFGEVFFKKISRKGAKEAPRRAISAVAPEG